MPIPASIARMAPQLPNILAATCSFRSSPSTLATCPCSIWPSSCSTKRCRLSSTAFVGCPYRFRCPLRLNDVSASTLRLSVSLRLCRPVSAQTVSHRVNMSTKFPKGRSGSNYDRAAVNLMLAFYCITGSKPEDQRARNAIETAIVILNKAELAAAPTNIFRFHREGTRPDN